MNKIKGYYDSMMPNSTNAKKSLKDLQEGKFTGKNKGFHKKSKSKLLRSIDKRENNEKSERNKKSSSSKSKSKYLKGIKNDTVKMIKNNLTNSLRSNCKTPQRIKKEINPVT